MHAPKRPIAFVLASTNHGSMIVNRNDYRIVDSRIAYGVGYQLLGTSTYEGDEIAFSLGLLRCRRQHGGNGVIAIDAGANIGVHTVEWARHMAGWGEVYAFEAQEAVFYALAGNIALNNCLNAHARLAALSSRDGELLIPKPDYFRPASFGSLELRKRENTEFIGQEISYDAASCCSVPALALDSLRLPRVDLIKVDVEGMELEVLAGATQLIESHRPILVVEVLKAEKGAIEAFAANLGYRVFSMGMNALCIHAQDKSLAHVTQNGATLSLAA